jgi:hypothetical protein
MWVVEGRIRYIANSIAAIHKIYNTTFSSPPAMPYIL